MIKQTLLAAAVAAALAGPGTAAAVTDAEMKELREQVQQMKREYEQRIEALEKRLQQAEGASQKAEGAAARAEGVAANAVVRSVKAESAAVQAGSRPASEAAFNPAVSLILNGVYSNLSQDPARFRITGFAPTGGDVAPGKRGFGLGESELALAANVDHYFRGTLIAALQPDNGIGVEEGYLQSLGLSNGFTLKAGRFYSSIGYQNEIHAHAWDFTDAPLANKVFLGNQLADDGLQLRWLAPTDTYFELGAEAGRGRRFPGSDRDKNGSGAANLFARLGGDIGASTAWRLGLSNLRTTTQNRNYNDFDSTGTEVNNSFNGASRLWVLDGILKWAPNGNGINTNFKLQGEYFRRSEDGNLTYNSANAAAFRGTSTGTLRSVQSGWYAQGVYQFMPMWRAGYRYDRLSSGSVKLGQVDSGALSAADFPIHSRYNPTRNTLMLDFNPSEFSRLRLQFASDKSRLGATDKQVFLQYSMSLGAHGAHKF
ncbi:MAG: hypothetical protein HY848_01070 [Betaproteobacteria bacterium]|nr:hypothetical protein [Betaproteobacteria bacterium]